MATETNDGLITEPTLHLRLNEHAIRALATAARKSHLQLIAEQIERQLLPARVEQEPIAFGSVVKNLDGCLFVRLGAATFAPWGSGDRRYQWADLHVIEVLRVGVGEPIPPTEAVEADEAPHVPCPDCSDAPNDPDQHADGCRRRGLGQHLQFGPPWHPFPEPTPEQVEAASAPEWARLDASNAESDAIEALVAEYAEGLAHKDYSAGSLFLSFSRFAGRVLEVGGQQPGVPDVAYPICGKTGPHGKCVFSVVHQAICRNANGLGIGATS